MVAVNGTNAKRVTSNKTGAVTVLLKSKGKAGRAAIGREFFQGHVGQPP
jgi:hypothetical protein